MEELERTAYSKPVLKETCEEIKDGIKKITGAEKLPEKIKEAIK